MNMKSVSFDFDDTLDNEEVQLFAAELIKRNIDVWILTARVPNDQWNWNNDIYKVCDKLNISRKKILMTNISSKSFYIQYKNLDFVWHLDDDKDDIESITKETNVKAIWYCPVTNWKEECLSLL